MTYQYPDELYYMAPIQNALFIAFLGILSYNKIQENEILEKNSISIADPFVNARRKRFHDYVPLYWATHTPMQYVVTIRDRKISQNELVFFVIDAKKVLDLPGVLTTDGNAASSDTKILPGKAALSLVDWYIVLHVRNCYSREYKWKKCAEVLVPNTVPTALITKAVVFSEIERDLIVNSLEDICKKIKLPKPKIPVEVNRKFYY